MDLSINNLCIAIFLLLISKSNGATTNLFREYIGADLNSVKFTDVPINPKVEFHFILSFSIDYTKGNNPAPTDGKFDTFWYTEHLGPADVSAIKNQRKNVKVAVSLGGDSVGKNQPVYFEPKSVTSWVKNAVTTLTRIIKMYGLDGIDIDYEHFHSDPNTFTECIGQLVTTLKKEGVISFASIAPFDEPEVKSHYMTLWRKYGHVIDYVNFQFYAFDKMKTANEFVGSFNEQMSNYEGGKLLASFATDNNEGGLPPDNRFFDACAQLKKQGKLGGIFVWSADDSKKLNYGPEKKCQRLLALP